MTPSAIPAWVPGVTLGANALVSPLAGAAALAKGRAERKQAEANAYIGETRALQTATTMQESLAGELGTLRASLAANGQGLDAGSMPFVRELRRTRLREMRVAVGNERQGAADQRQQGRNAAGGGSTAFLSGLLATGPSMFDVWDYQMGPREDSLLWNPRRSREG